MSKRKSDEQRTSEAKPSYEAMRAVAVAAASVLTEWGAGNIEHASPGGRAALRRLDDAIVKADDDARLRTGEAEPYDCYDPAVASWRERIARVWPDWSARDRQITEDAFHAGWMAHRRADNLSRERDQSNASVSNTGNASRAEVGSDAPRAGVREATEGLRGVPLVRGESGGALDVVSRAAAAPEAVMSGPKAGLDFMGRARRFIFERFDESGNEDDVRELAAEFAMVALDAATLSVSQEGTKR